MKSQRKTGSSGGKRKASVSSRCERCGAALDRTTMGCPKCPPADSRRLTRKGDSALGEGCAPRLLAGKVLVFPDAIEGERKPVTILVADISDYSSFSEKLRPEALYRVMARCFAIMNDEIGHYGGTMIQPSGGTVTGIFGAPISHEAHATMACEAALSIVRRMGPYTEEIRDKTGPAFVIRIGLVSGTVLTESVQSGTELDHLDMEAEEDLIASAKAIMEPNKVVAAGSTYGLAADFFEFKHVGKAGTDSPGPPAAYELVDSRAAFLPMEARQSKPLSKFVGRELEMSMLQEAAEKTRQGYGQVVAVTGDAGIGKSRLVLEFNKRLAPGKWACFEGRCRSYDGASSYNPILDLLKSIFGIDLGENQSSVKRKIREGMSRFVPGRDDMIAPLYEVFALDVEDSNYPALSVQEKKSRIFQAIETVLIAACRDKHPVLIIEDLHWIDRSSEEVLAHLAARINRIGMLLILLFRPEYTAACPFVSDLSNVHLDSIPSNRVGKLVESVLGGSAEESVTALVSERAGGNPLFVEEFIRTLSDEGAVKKVEDRFLLNSSAAGELLPKTVQAVISARIDRLEKDVKRTLQTASVIGCEFSHDLLERTAAAGRGLGLQLSRLQQLEFIRETSNGQYEFKHALTREAAYKGLLAKSRKKIHQRAGQAIEKLYSGTLTEFYEQLAYHFSRSRDAEKEYQYLKLCAAKASRQSSWRDALQFGKKALLLLKDRPVTVSPILSGPALPSISVVGGTFSITMILTPFSLRIPRGG